MFHCHVKGGEHFVSSLLQAEKFISVRSMCTEQQLLRSSIFIQQIIVVVDKMNIVTTAIAAWGGNAKYNYIIIPLKEIKKLSHFKKWAVRGRRGSAVSPGPGSCSAAGRRDSAGGGFLFVQEMPLLTSTGTPAPSTHPF